MDLVPRLGALTRIPPKRLPLQNVNDLPWVTTFPPPHCTRIDARALLPPRLSCLRAQRAYRLLRAKEDGVLPARLPESVWLIC